MDLLKQQLQRISEQIGALSATQKMLTASLVVIMVITLFWWTRYAAKAEMVPVLDRAISADELPSIKGTLRVAGIESRVINDRVMVPAERQLEALAMLGWHKQLPADSADAWDQLINKQSSPWETSEKSSARMNHAKELVLSQIIRSYFPSVKRAAVMIEPTYRRQLGGGGDVQPSASIAIDATGDRHDQIVDGAAALVSNAQAGLKISRVSVVVNGRRYRPRDPAQDGSFGGSDLYDLIHKQEERYVNKIRDNLACDAALVTVSVEVETASSQETREMYDPKNTVSKETLSETKTSETRGGSALASGEPGATANTGLSVEQPAAATEGPSTLTEDQRTQMEVRFGKTVEQINKPAGRIRVTRAAVRLPQSWFVAQYKTKNPTSGEPDDAALEPLITRELEDVKRHVMACCGLADEQSISVATYPDSAPLLAAVTSETSPAGSMGSLISSHVKEIAIGSLAVLSLFMVMMMVRRNGHVATITPPDELKPVVPLASGEDIAGEAAEGTAMLDGMELDEETIKAQQMVDQVSTMVSENPDFAANLVKRWLNRS